MDINAGWLAYAHGCRPQHRQLRLRCCPHGNGQSRGCAAGCADSRRSCTERCQERRPAQRPSSAGLASRSPAGHAGGYHRWGCHVKLLPGAQTALCASRRLRPSTAPTMQAGKSAPARRAQPGCLSLPPGIQRAGLQCGGPPRKAGQMLGASRHCLLAREAQHSAAQRSTTPKRQSALRTLRRAWRPPVSQQLLSLLLARGWPAANAELEVSPPRLEGVTGPSSPALAAAPAASQASRAGPTACKPAALKLRTRDGRARAGDAANEVG